MLAINSVFQFSDTGGQTNVLFEDATFARADRILLNPDTGHVHALLNERSFLIGHLSGKLVEAFSRHAKVTLNGHLPDGSLLSLDADLVVLH